MTYIDMEMLVSEVQKQLFSDAAEHAVNREGPFATVGPTDAATTFALQEVPGEVKKGQSRHTLQIMDKQAPTSCNLPYWGRVLEEHVADMHPKTWLLPLECSSGSCRTLYIDGSQFLNPKRSDFCPTWLVQPVPAAALPSAASAADAAAAAAAEEAPQPSAPKRRRQSSSRAHADQPPEPTHKIVHLPMYVSITAALTGKEKSHRFKRRAPRRERGPPIEKNRNRIWICKKKKRKKPESQP